jgi:hypothetical protein
MYEIALGFIDKIPARVVEATIQFLLSLFDAAPL